MIDTECGTPYLIDEEKGKPPYCLPFKDKGSLRETRVRIGEGVAGHVAVTVYRPERLGYTVQLVKAER